MTYTGIHEAEAVRLLSNLSSRASVNPASAAPATRRMFGEARLRRARALAQAAGIPASSTGRCPAGPTSVTRRVRGATGNGPRPCREGHTDTVQVDPPGAAVRSPPVRGRRLSAGAPVERRRLPVAFLLPPRRSSRRPDRGRHVDRSRRCAHDGIHPYAGIDTPMAQLAYALHPRRRRGELRGSHAFARATVAAGSWQSATGAPGNPLEQPARGLSALDAAPLMSPTTGENGARYGCSAPSEPRTVSRVTGFEREGAPPRCLVNLACGRLHRYTLPARAQALRLSRFRASSAPLGRALSRCLFASSCEPHPFCGFPRARTVPAGHYNSRGLRAPGERGGRAGRGSREPRHDAQFEASLRLRPPATNGDARRSSPLVSGLRRLPRARPRAQRRRLRRVVRRRAMLVELRARLTACEAPRAPGRVKVDMTRVLLKSDRAGRGGTRAAPPATVTR